RRLDAPLTPLPLTTHRRTFRLPLTTKLLHRLRPPRDGGNARPRYLDQTQLGHDRNELLDLGRAPRDLEHEVFGGGVDHVCAKYLGQAQRLNALVAPARNLDQCQLPLHWVTGYRQIDDAMHVDQPLQLALDLCEHHRRSRSDDGKPRKMLLVLGL